MAKMKLYGVAGSRAARSLWMARELAEAGEEALQKPLAVLNDALEGRDYLLDGEFSVADLNVASVLSWARMGQLDMSAVPNVDAWLTRCMERPAFNG